jgi:hypothetical protein
MERSSGQHKIAGCPPGLLAFPASSSYGSALAFFYWGSMGVFCGQHYDPGTVEKFPKELMRRVKNR